MGTATKEKMLIVDDEPDITAILEIYLEPYFDITTTNLPQEAAKMLLQQHFDILITDIKMPELDGNQLMLKALQAQPQIHVIQCTGHAITDEEIAQSIDKGACNVMVKPFGSPEKVLEFIKSSCNT